MTDWNHSTPLVSAPSYAQAMIPLRVEGADPTNPALDTFEQVAVATVIAAAGYGGSAGQPVSIDLFVNLGAHRLPGAVTAFITGGCSTGGMGGGTYLADSLATSALAASCPRFCAADSAGRYFRLAAPGGAIAISQGGALGGANNDQPAVQAAIDYAAAIGARTLLFDFDSVSLWCPPRTSNVTDAWAPDGQSIWVTAPIKFMGLGSGTHIKLLSTTGTSLDTGWQNVGGNVWRGSGINLIGGSSSSPNANNLTAFEMENIWLDGGCSYTGVRTVVTVSSPDGPDLTNKGLRLQNTQCDKIILTNCIISGFKGEACYIAGSTQTLQILKNTQIFGSNQSAFNPSTGIVQADNCDFGGSYIAVEGLGGIGGRYTNCRFHDANQLAITGGPGNGFQTGFIYNYPSRDLTKAPPWVDLINCELVNIGQVIVANYVRMTRCRATDSLFFLSIYYTGGVLTSTYIDLDYTADQIGCDPIFFIQGPPDHTSLIPGGQTTAYMADVCDLHIRVNVHRTANAIANSRTCVVYGIDGYFDQNSCSLHVGDADGVVQITTPNFGGTQYSQPLVTCDQPSASQNLGGALFAATVSGMTSGPYALTVSSPRHALQNTGTAAAIAITMAAPYASPYGHASGQRCKIFWEHFSTAGTTYTFARNGTGLRLNSDCTLAVSGDWVAVEYNAVTGLWHETGRSIHAA